MEAGWGTGVDFPPEMVGGTGYTVETDVWSLGCTLYSLCAYKPPFEWKDPDEDESVKSVCELPHDRIPPTYSDELNEILLSMLRKDPKERPTAQEVLSKIEDLLRGRQTGTSQA